MVVDIRIGRALRRMEFEVRRPATPEERTQMVRVLVAAARKIDRDVPMSRECRLVCEKLADMIQLLEVSSSE